MCYSNTYWNYETTKLTYVPIAIFIFLYIIYGLYTLNNHKSSENVFASKNSWQLIHLLRPQISGYATDLQHFPPCATCYWQCLLNWDATICDWVGTFGPDNRLCQLEYIITDTSDIAQHGEPTNSTHPLQRVLSYFQCATINWHLLYYKYRLLDPIVDGCTIHTQTLSTLVPSCQNNGFNLLFLLLLMLHHEHVLLQCGQ